MTIDMFLVEFQPFLNSKIFSLVILRFDHHHRRELSFCELHTHVELNLKANTFQLHLNFDCFH